MAAPILADDTVGKLTSASRKACSTHPWSKEVTSSIALAPSSGMQNPLPQEIELGPPISLSLDQFEARNLALHLPLTPR